MFGVQDALTKMLVSLPLPGDTAFEIVIVLEMAGMMSVFLAVNCKFIIKTWEGKKTLKNKS